MYNLKIITATVRPSRKGPIVTEWVAQKARQHGEFNVEVLDLQAINLPLMNEPHHPAQLKYEHEHTKQWSAQIAAADAFIFVTAEYNFSYPAPLQNALEYLVKEWGYKAAGIVSYGGVSAGTRAWNALKNDLSSYRIVPLVEAVNIPFFTEFIQNDHLLPNDISEKALDAMLRELARWTKGLKSIRENQ
ncbi:NADPH-dependent FMN reductase [Hymenobacter radiodurans]|uniref:NADPH-dependent FMN reductase n=1 Tax=Hymenobacter radiodurans TaxID=2496028 RepID=UPI0010587855|nr:NADPH-dependent FMN reductase [Hymenobacter radiodurans]